MISLPFLTFWFSEVRNMTAGSSNELNVVRKKLSEALGESFGQYTLYLRHGPLNIFFSNLDPFRFETLVGSRIFIKTDGCAFHRAVFRERIVLSRTGFYSSQCRGMWIRIRKIMGISDPDPSFFVRIRILWLSSNKSKKNLIFVLWLPFMTFYLWRLF